MVTVDVESGPPTLLERVAGEWRDLCSRASNNEAFYRPEWLQCWLRAFMPAAELTLFTARAGGRLVAVLPLLIQHGFSGGVPARIASSPTNYHSCRFDLLREAGSDGDAAIGEIWRSVNGKDGWDVLCFDYVPCRGALAVMRDHAAADGLPVWTRDSWRSPYIVIDGWDRSADFWLKRTNAHFSRNIRRVLRKCAASGPLRLERVDNADAAALAKFYAVESSGWKGTSGTGIRNDAATLQFYDEVASQAASFGYGRLYLLYHGDQLAAGHFGFTYNGKYLTAKCAFEESLRSIGPGHLIVNAILSDCAEAGLRELDLCGDAEEWKTKWTSAIHSHSTIFIFRRSTYGQLLYQWRSRLVPTVGAALRNLQQRSARKEGS